LEGDRRKEDSMKKILLISAAVVVNIFVLYVFAMVTYLTFTLKTIQQPFVINGDEDKANNESGDEEGTSELLYKVS
jgi:hypothetical protein